MFSHVLFLRTSHLVNLLMFPNKLFITYLLSSEFVCSQRICLVREIVVLRWLWFRRAATYAFER